MLFHDLLVQWYGTNISHVRIAGMHTMGLLLDLEGCHILVNHSVLQPWPGEVVSLATYHELGRALSSHQFLCNLLGYYQIELQQLSPSGILHIVAFVMLCEAFLEIHLHFSLWKYFLLTRTLRKEAPVVGGVVL
jgi:hypothetical protein